jgi:hypothetical protein
MNAMPSETKLSGSQGGAGSPGSIFRTSRIGDIVTPEPGCRWLVRSVWAANTVGILAGSPRAGKTWFSLDLAVSIASGTPCLGRFEVERRGPVLLFLAEDSPEAARQRVEGICRHRGLDIAMLDLYLIIAPALRLPLPEDTKKLFTTVEAIKPILLVLDPFVRIHAGIDENNAGDVSRLLADLRLLQRTHEVSVLVVHHLRKNGRGSPGEALRGSGDLYAWTDSLATLSRPNGALQLAIEHRFERATEPVALKLATLPDGTAPHLEIDTLVPSSPGARDLAARVLEELGRAEVPVRRSDLRERLRVNNNKLGSVLDELAREGHIRREGDGWTVRGETR